MQVHFIKSTLKPPGTKRCKLDNVELLLNSAFKFKLRRYIKECRRNTAAAAAAADTTAAAATENATTAVNGDGAMSSFVTGTGSSGAVGASVAGAPAVGVGCAFGDWSAW